MFTHPPIQLKDISISYGTKCCFENFSTLIYPGQRIAIIGQNGAGKSSLLKSIITKPEIQFAYVPQIIEDHDQLSGGQKFNKALSLALAQNPDVLCLDEPTNHLDTHNRKQLMKMLDHYMGTIIMVTHDLELIEHCTDEIWHIYNQRVEKFSGNYQDYLAEWQRKRDAILDEVHHLKFEKKQAHNAFMKEKNRASKSTQRGKKNITNRKYPTITSHAKAGRSEQTSGKKKQAIYNKKEKLEASLDSLYLPEIIIPTFEMPIADHCSQSLISIFDGACGYDDMLLKDINFQMKSGERIALKGTNGSGKTTLVKAILKDGSVNLSGEWQMAKKAIGFLDQHYHMLTPSQTVLGMIEEQKPDWDLAKIRYYLNQFLFKNNHQVNQRISELSGGEKARLCLSLIAAAPPQLLILDEVTNNLDLETRAHVIEVLKAYPGGLLVISHDQNFLDEIGMEREITCKDMKLL